MNQIAEGRPTPGPWVSKDTGSQPCAFSVVGDGNQLAALVYGETRQTQKANARLISAAPDMLAALIEFVAEADRVTVAFKMAQAAIAKATGNGVSHTTGKRE